MDLIWFLLIGLAAGWLASQLMEGGASSLTTDLILGVVGAMVGGFLFRLLNILTIGLLGNLISATVGAMILIAAMRAIKKKA